MELGLAVERKKKLCYWWIDWLIQWACEWVMHSLIQSLIHSFIHSLSCSYHTDKTCWNLWDFAVQIIVVWLILNEKTLCISAFMDHVHSSDDLWRGGKVPLEPIWSHQGMSQYFSVPRLIIIYSVLINNIYFILDLASFWVSTHSSWQDGSQSQP